MMIKTNETPMYCVHLATPADASSVPTPTIAAAVDVIERTPGATYHGAMGDEFRLFRASPVTAAAVQATLGKNFLIENMSDIEAVCKTLRDVGFAQLQASGLYPGLQRSAVSVTYDSTGYGMIVNLGDVTDKPKPKLPSRVAGLPAQAIYC